MPKLSSRGSAIRYGYGPQIRLLLHQPGCDLQQHDEIRVVGDSVTNAVIIAITRMNISQQCPKDRPALVGGRRNDGSKRGAMVAMFIKANIAQTPLPSNNAAKPVPAPQDRETARTDPENGGQLKNHQNWAANPASVARTVRTPAAISKPDR